MDSFSWDNKYAGAELLFAMVRGYSMDRSQRLGEQMLVGGRATSFSCRTSWRGRHGMAVHDDGCSNSLVANANWFQLADMNEFSWDNKYAGMQLLFATVREGGGKRGKESGLLGGRLVLSGSPPLPSPAPRLGCPQSSLLRLSCSRSLV